MEFTYDGTRIWSLGQGRPVGTIRRIRGLLGTIGAHEPLGRPGFRGPGGLVRTGVRRYLSITITTVTLVRAPLRTSHGTPSGQNRPLDRRQPLQHSSPVCL